LSCNNGKTKKFRASVLPYPGKNTGPGLLWQPELPLLRKYSVYAYWRIR
jgi:hypothetical protein